MEARSTQHKNVPCSIRSLFNTQLWGCSLHLDKKEWKQVFKEASL